MGPGGIWKSGLLHDKISLFSIQYFRPPGRLGLRSQAAPDRFGHGLMDLTGYDKYLTGQLTDYSLPESEIAKYQKDMEGLPKAAANKTGKW